MRMFSLTALMLPLWLSRAPVAEGQEVALATQGPRFLYSATMHTRPVEIDAGRSALLRRVVSLELKEPTVGRVLDAIERQMRIKLFFSPELLRLDRAVTLHANAITVAAALTEVLLGTGLDVLVTAANQVALVKRNAAPAAQRGRVTGRVTDANKNQGIGGAEVLLEGTKWRTTTGDDGRYMLAEVEPGSYTITARRIGYGKRSEPVTVGGQEVVADFALQAAATRLGDVVVTAQKREERLQDVPVPVTAVRADALTNYNQLQLQDYYTTVPGFSVSPAPSAGALVQLALRGISSGSATTPTVGILIDDVPYGFSANGFQSTLPDVDPSTLARVEVLRGPQGTLYGANSMGGLLNFVTVEPSTDRMSGRLQVGTSSVSHGNGLGYNLRGTVNVPFSSTLAVNASGFTRQDPGYIDNPVRHIDGLNEAQVSGGRLSTLWRPSEAFSVRLSALYQDYTGDGAIDVHANLGDLQQNYLPGIGAYQKKAQAYSAKLTAKVGSVDLTAISGYNINESFASNDITELFGSTTQALFGVPGSPLFNESRTERFTQELRLSAPIGQRLRVLLGGFYSREKPARYVQEILAADPATGAVVGSVFRAGTTRGDGRHEEYAAFANLTFDVTDRIDVQIGGRASQLRDKGATGFAEGVLLGGVTITTTPPLDAKADAFTYLVTPRFKVSPNLMVYARLASGFRPGGGAPGRPGNACVSFNFTCQFRPDKTQNYEIGVKGNVLGGALSYDASLYYIDWKDLQVRLLSSLGTNYTDNAGGARSQGVEFSVESRPLTGLTIATSGAWIDAELTEDPPAGTTIIGAVVGDGMPYVSRFSGNLSLDQEFPLATNVTGSVGGTVTYVGSRLGTLGSIGSLSSQRERYPAYTKIDLRAGVRRDAWMANVFVNNIADERGALGGGLGHTPHYAFTYIQPRTVGLSLSRTF